MSVDYYIISIWLLQSKDIHNTPIRMATPNTMTYGTNFSAAGLISPVYSCYRLAAFLILRMESKVFGGQE